MRSVFLAVAVAIRLHRSELSGWLNSSTNASLNSSSSTPRCPGPHSCKCKPNLVDTMRAANKMRAGGSGPLFNCDTEGFDNSNSSFPCNQASVARRTWLTYDCFTDNPAEMGLPEDSYCDPCRPTNTILMYDTSLAQNKEYE